MKNMDNLPILRIIFNQGIIILTDQVQLSSNSQEKLEKD